MSVFEKNIIMEIGSYIAWFGGYISNTNDTGGAKDSGSEADGSNGGDAEAGDQERDEKD